MKGLKFSVVIPCYNDVRIEHSVKSCLLQTYAPYEIIIVDDCSKPAIKQLVSEIAFKHSGMVKAILLKQNVGVSTARNIGMKNSHGDYICLLDSDDVWHPEKLRTVNNFIEKVNASVALAHDFTYDIGEFNTKQKKAGSIKQIKFHQILFKNPITTPSLTIPRSINIMFREDMRYAEDHEFLLRLSRKCKIFFLPEKLVFINRVVGSKGGLSGETGKMRVGEMRMYVLLCQTDWRFYPLLPFFIFYSLAKHARQLILTSIKKQ